MKYRWIGVLVMWLIGAAIVPLVAWMSASNQVDFSIALALIVPVSLLLLIPPARWWARQRHLAAMAEAGLICPKCAYSTQGLDEGVRRCPECGHPRERLPKNRLEV